MERRRLALIPIAMMTLVLLSLSTISTGAQVESPPGFYVELVDYPDTIQPGGTYDIKVKVTRPSGMELPAWGTAGDQKWEVRVYFYETSSPWSCFTEGDWSEIGGSYLYSGWWDDRTQGGSWTSSMSDTREFTITAQVVDKPRANPSAPDGSATYNEIPVDGEVNLKAKLRLRGMTNLQFTNDNLTFDYYNQTFGGSYENLSSGSEKKYKVGNLYMEWSDGDYWQIDYEAKTTASVSAAGGGGLGVPIWVLGAIGAVIIVVIIAIVAVKMSGGEEVPVEPAPSY